MPQRGRKPKPTAIKKLEGNPGKRPLNDEDLKYNVPIGDCPEHLQGAAREEWERVIKATEGLNLFTALDRVSLEMYCQCYATWRECEDFIARKGYIYKNEKTGLISVVPHVQISRDQVRNIMRLCEQFGFTPSSRSRILTSDKVCSEDDVMESLLSWSG